MAMASPVACSLQADCNCHPSCNGVTVAERKIGAHAKDIKQEKRTFVRMITNRPVREKWGIVCQVLCRHPIEALRSKLRVYFIAAVNRLQQASKSRLRFSFLAPWWTR